MKTKILILISLTTCLMVFSQKDCTEPCNMQVEDYKIYTNSTYNGCVNDNQNYHGKGVEVKIGENIKQTYNGCWKNGKRHGTGTLTQSDGWRYEGNWKNGKRHGSGTLNLANGDKYEGEFYKNEFHGTGTYYKKNEYNQEEWWTGIWEEDERKDGYWNYENHYNPDDIKIKDSEIGTISLPKDLKGREMINVEFNNLKVGFLYDTGADDIIITRKLLEKLKSDDVIVTKLGITKEFSVANSQKTQAEAYSINKLTVGNVEVNNVIVFVWTNENGSVLLGEGFWKKFARTIRCIDSEIGSEITIYN